MCCSLTLGGCILKPQRRVSSYPEFRTGPPQEDLPKACQCPLFHKLSQPVPLKTAARISSDSSTPLPNLLERWRHRPGGPGPVSGSAPRLPSGPDANPLIFKHKDLLQVRIWPCFPGFPSDQWPLKTHLGLAVEWRAVILNASAGGCIVYAPVP